MAPFFSEAGTRPSTGCTLGFGTPLSAQLIARVGYDFVLIDMEHNPLSAREAAHMTHAVIAASGGKCSPFIRVPSHGVEWIKWALDSGAHGILIPMVQSSEEMEAIIQHAIYPPRGQRSFGPTMAPFASVDPTYTAPKYLERSQDISIIPMIESAHGLAKIEEICAIDGVSAVFIGPVDLRFSLGLPGGDGSELEYIQALNHAVESCRKYRKPIGTFAKDALAYKKRTAEGFNFLLLPGEVAMLVAGAKAQLEDCLKALNSPLL